MSDDIDVVAPVVTKLRALLVQVLQERERRAEQAVNSNMAHRLSARRSLCDFRSRQCHRQGH